MRSFSCLPSSAGGGKTDKKQKGKLPGEMGTGLGDPCH